MGRRTYQNSLRRWNMTIACTGKITHYYIMSNTFSGLLITCPQQPLVFLPIPMVTKQLSMTVDILLASRATMYDHGLHYFSFTLCAEEELHQQPRVHQDVVQQDSKGKPHCWI